MTMPPNDTMATSIDHSFIKNDEIVDWDQVKLLTTNALNNGDYRAIIDHSSPIIDDLQKKLIYLLKKRVVAWARTANYIQELKEATTIIQYAPHDPEGYLCMGRRYADQGLQTKAIEVFNNGLRNVPQTDAQYNKLCDAKYCALTRRRQRIDILAEVPYDIMGIIAEQIPEKTLRECIMVSSIWRQRLLSYSGCWKSIHIKKFGQSDHFLTPTVYHTLELSSHHIKELSLPHCPRVPRALKMLATKNFSRLQTLEIQEPPVNDYNDRYMSLCYSLPNISESLTTLDISLIGCQEDFLSQILNICRNLTTLRFCNRSNGYSFIRHALPYRTCLKNVVLEAPNDSLLISDLALLFQCAPDIQHLGLKGCPDDIYATVSEYCQNINVFEVSRYTKVKLCDFDNLPSQQYDGLTKLRAESPISKLALAPLIERHSTALRDLFIVFPPEEHSAQPIGNWDNISSFSLHGLTDLNLQDIPGTVTRQLPSLISQCPNLKEIGLYSVNDSIPGETFIAAAKLKRLISLTVLEAEMSDSDEQGLLQFLRDAQQPHDGKSGLATLKLEDCMRATATVVASSGISTLTNLSICCYIDLDDREELNFATALGNIPKLQTLHLANISLSEQNLLRISENKSLKEVDLYNIFDLTAAEVRDAFASSVNLKFEELHF